MRILFASSEVAPFAKTGGLADVAGALPKALKALGHDIRVVLPKYRMVDAAAHGLRRIGLAFPIPWPAASRRRRVGGAVGAVPAYFIQQDDYYDREGLYQVAGKDHPDNAERFAFFSRAVLELARAAGFRRRSTTATTGRPAWSRPTFAPPIRGPRISRAGRCSPSTTWDTTACSNPLPWPSRT